MTVRELIDTGIFGVANEGDFTEAEITKLYTCDLLSVAMGRAPEGACWVTVVSNINTLAVASLTNSACVILAENVEANEMFAKKAEQQGITVLTSALPSFDAALQVWKLLEAEKSEA